jgi:chemotaxis protein MotB
LDDKGTVGAPVAEKLALDGILSSTFHDCLSLAKEEEMKIALIVVAALILVFGCASKKPSQQEVKQSSTSSVESRQTQAKTTTYQELTWQLQREVKAGQAQIKQFEEGIKITMVNDILFPEGGWKTHRGGKEALDKVIVVLKGRKGLAFEVYGFTDNTPIGPMLRRQFSSNRELSLARAVDVVSYMEEKGINRDLISATGYGDERPIAPNDTPVGRRKNQRVEIIVLVSDL